MNKISYLFSKNKKKYLEYLVIFKGLSERTIQSYCYDIDLYIEYLNKKNINIDELAAYNFTDRYINHLKDKLNFSYNSISRMISSLKGFELFLLQDEIIDKPIWQRVEKPKNKRSLPCFLSKDEINLLIKYKEKNHYYNVRNSLMIEVAYTTGIRVNELVNILVNNISFIDNNIILKTKGNKERIVNLHEKTTNKIQDFIKKERNYFLNTPTDILFLTKKSQKMSPSNFYQCLLKRAKKTNINKPVHPHCLRHSFATHLLNEGADLFVIQKLLGHEDISTTEIYTHISNKKIFDSYHKLHPLSNLQGDKLDEKK